jgi:hypothetical protein
MKAQRMVVGTWHLTANGNDEERKKERTKALRGSRGIVLLFL